MRLLIIDFVIILIISGCASTNIQSVKYNPEENRYKKILLFIPISDLIVRHDIEQALMDEFNRPEEVSLRGIRAFKWLDNDSTFLKEDLLINCSEIVPLWDELTTRELDSALSQYGFDASLIVTPGNYWTTATYIPRTTSYEVDIASKTVGNTEKTTGTITNHTVGGYTVTVPHWQFDSRLYSFDNNKLIWKATSVSSGSIFDNRLAKSYAKKLLKKLQSDEVIPIRMEKWR